MTRNTTKHIAVLEADTPVPAVQTVNGSYGDIFSTLFNNVASSDYKLRWSYFNVVEGIYPTEEELKDIDAVLVTGSRDSVYDPILWIQKLKEFIKDIFYRYSDIRILGSCFGHQMIAHAILDDIGAAHVEPNTKGWEIGTTKINIDPKFANACKASKTIMNLQSVHRDHVKISQHGLPDGWASVGTSDLSPCQGLYLPRRVFSLQAHCEFDAFINKETVSYFFAGLDQEQLDKWLSKISSDKTTSDESWAAQLFVSFLYE